MDPCNGSIYLTNTAAASRDSSAAALSRSIKSCCSMSRVGSHGGGGGARFNRYNTALGSQVQVWKQYLLKG